MKQQAMFVTFDGIEKTFLGQTHLYGLLILTLGLLLVWVRHSNGRSDSEAPRPPRVSYLLPWIGSAIDMGKNPDAFFQRASAELGPVFNVKAAGQNITYITSADLISAIYRETKAFEFTPIRLDMMGKVFQMSHTATYSSFIVDRYLPMHQRMLSSQNIIGLLQSYTSHARECILKAVEDFHGTCTPLVPFLIPPAYESAALSFFGRAFDAERSYEPFRRFDDYFHFIMAGVPRFMLPGPHRAYKNLRRIFEDYLQAPHGDCSDIIESVEMAARDAGLSNQDIAAAMGMELWALQANTPWVAYWLIALELQKPQGVAPLVTEIDQARMNWKIGHPDGCFEANLHPWLLDSPLPLLASTIQEVLRLSTSTFSIRRVNEPVIFAGYRFDAGERIVCATRCVHLDEEIHPDARKCVPERYMSSQKKITKNGKVVPNHSMPFGGGVSMCEGRHFALGELKIYLALLLTYAIVELDPESTTRPRYYTERMGVGLMPPKGDLGVRIRKRNVV